MVKGTLKNRFTGEVSEVELSYEIIIKDDKSIFQLIGGPTGYESFYMDEDAKRLIENGWLACSGTKNKYDELFIPAIEMKKIKGLNL